MLELLLQTAVNALYASSYIALVSVGLVLIFGVMRIVNFAHGELYMLGAYCIVAFYVDSTFSFVVALLAAPLLLACVGLAMERGLFRPVRDKPLSGLVLSIGFLLMLQALAAILFGVRMENIPPPTQVVLRFSEGVTLPLQRLFVILAALLLLGGLWGFLKKSRFGQALRACAQDPEAAQLQGIARNRTAQGALVIGAAMAGVAGALTAPLVRVFPYMGHSVIITAFIVVIVGGLGSLEGAVIASILYAFVHTTVTTFFDGVIANIVGLLMMLLVLVFKPMGLFGGKERA